MNFVDGFAVLGETSPLRSRTRKKAKEKRKLARTRVYSSNLVSSFHNHEDERMATQRFEKVFASGIYLLMGISTAYIFSVGLANGIASGYRYPIQQKLLIGAALAGAATLLVSSILVHFRPAKAYSAAMVAMPLLLLAFWPFILAIALEVIIHRASPLRTFSLIDLFAMVLLAIVTVFTPLQLLKLLRS